MTRTMRPAVTTAADATFLWMGQRHPAGAIRKRLAASMARGRAAEPGRAPFRALRRHPAGYKHWPTCPNHLISAAPWQYSVRLWNAKNISPLADWPGGYSSSVSRSLEHLPAELAKKAEKDRKTKKPPGGKPPRRRRGGRRGAR